MELGLQANNKYAQESPRDLLSVEDATCSSYSLQQKIELQITRTLDSDFEFNRSHFLFDEHPIARILDGDFVEQIIHDVSHDARKSLIELIESGSQLDNQELSILVSTAIDRAKSLRCEISELWQKCKDLPNIGNFGSASNSVWSDSLGIFLVTFSLLCVQDGISNLNGGAKTGSMQRFSRAWQEAKSSLQGEGLSSEAVVMQVLLRSWSENFVEAPSPDGTPGFISPKMVTFLSRTPLLLTLGQRLCDIVTPGGLGTLEELFRRLAETKLKDRLMAGVFYGIEDAPPIYLLSPEMVKEKGPFFEPMHRLIKLMINTGGAHESQFKRVVIDTLEEPEQLATKIHQEAIQRKGQVVKRWTPPTSDYSLCEGALRDLSRRLDCDPQFNQRYFGIDRPMCQRMLDAHYKVQVKIEAEKALYERYVVLSQISSYERERAANEATQFAFNKAIHWRPQLYNFIASHENEPVIVVVGSSKDNIWNKELATSTKELVSYALKRGYSLVLSGDGREGVAKRVSDEWFKQRKESNGRYNPHSKLIRVQLKLDGEELFRRNEDGAREVLGPPMLNIISKTSLLNMFGRQLSMIVYPGGPCEMEIVAGALLAKQMPRHKVLTTYCDPDVPDKDHMPALIFLNSRLKLERSYADRDSLDQAEQLSEPFFEPFSDQLEMMKETNSIQPEDVSHIQFLDTSNRKVVKEAFAGLDAISTKIAHIMSNGRRQEHVSSLP